MTKTMLAFLPPDEQEFYDSVVHGLRAAGWSRIDAEGEALDRIEKMRERTKADPAARAAA